MKNLLITSAVIALVGCASIGAHTENNAINLMANLCDKGDMEQCKRRSMFQIKAGLRSRSEASEEFLPNCLRVAKRHSSVRSVDCEKFAVFLLTYKPPTIGY